MSAERVAHREWIGGAILTLLSHYWREDDPVELTAAIGADWADVLEGIPQKYIQMARISWAGNETHKPKPADIKKLALSYMPKPVIVPTEPEPDRERVSADAAADILAAAGFGPKRMGDA